MSKTYITQFMDDLETNGISANTLKNYRSDLLTFSSWFEQTNNEPLTPSGITPIDLKEYKQYLKVREYRPASINRKLASIKSFLTWANKSHIIDYTLSFPKQSKEVQQSPKWLDRKQQLALMRAAHKQGSPRNLAILTLLLNTGLRVSELCALKWQHIKMTDRKGLLVVTQGKGDKQRQIPLNKDARNALTTLERDSSGYVFCGQRGPLTSRGVQFMIERIANTNPNLNEVTAHSLRHTFCKNLINAGVGLEMVAKIAGHSSLESTRRYCEPSWHDLEKATELLSEG